MSSHIDWFSHILLDHSAVYTEHRDGDQYLVTTQDESRQFSKGTFVKRQKISSFFFFFPILYAVSILVTAAVYSNRKFGFLCWSWITQMIVLFLFDLLFCFYLTFLLSSPDHFTFHPSVTLSSYQFKLQTTNAITGKIFHFIPEWVRQGTIIEQTWPIKFPQGTKFNNFVRNRLHEDPSITIRVDPKSMVTVAQAY